MSESGPMRRFPARALRRVGMAVLLALCAPAQHLRNGDFEDGGTKGPPPGWFLPVGCADAGFELHVAREGAGEGKRCALLRRAAADAAKGSFGNCMQELDPAPLRGKRIRFRAAVRAEVDGPDGRGQLWLRVDRPGDRMGAFDNMADRPIREDTWQHYEITADVADDAVRVVVGLLMMGSGTVWIDDASLEIVGDDVPTTAEAARDAAAPGLVEVRMAADVTAVRAADATTLRFPLPLAYRDQTPLTFRLQLDPPVDASARIEIGPGPNRVLALELRDLPALTKFAIAWQSTVLVQPSDFADVPRRAPFPKAWPAEAEPWLASTWCCEHEDDRVAAVAAEVRGDETDVLRVIDRALDRAGKIFRDAEGRVTELTAVQALDHQGSCTSCANLLAALLRGAGVPTRILSGYPLWSGPLQTHYIVEAWVPDHGWYPIESTRCQAPWPNHEQVNVSIVPIEHEAKGLARGRPCAAGAVPFLSLTEYDDAAPLRLAGTLKQYCDHEARMVRALTGKPSQWTRARTFARERWERWLGAPIELTEGEHAFGPPAGDLADVELEDLPKALRAR
ncbi:MAG: transglutaminase family protein [Planctomycetota bacterium]